MMMLFISFFTALAVSLNKYANDKVHKNVKPTIFYLSEALISLICGFALGMSSKIICKDTFELWLVSSCIGSYLGKKSINLICSIILVRLHVSDEIIDNIDKSIDDDNISHGKDE